MGGLWSSLHPSSLFTLRSLLARPRVSRAELDAFRDARLRHLIRHAWERVPYYRRLFERHGLRPEDIRGVVDLAAIPISAKPDLQPLPAEEVTARGVDRSRLIVHQTSGSMGRPVTIRRTWREERVLNAFRRRALRYLGQRLADRHVNIGLTRPVDPLDERWPQRLLCGLGLRSLSIVDCRQPLPAIVRQLCELRPDVLSGFSGSLWRVALTATAAERQALRPRVILGGGEVLTPTMRRQIEVALAAPVYDLYGCHECNLIAWECKPTGAYHTCDDLLIVEVLAHGRPVEPGQRGELVITNLHSYAMPFIRFRLGDVVTKGAAECACGQPFATISAIEGRMNDDFPLPDGRLVHPYTLVVVILDNAPWVGEYRLVQERPDRIVLRVVPQRAPSSEEIAHVRARVADTLGAAVAFEIALAAELPIEPSGKTRVCRSLVSSPYDGLEWPRGP